MDERATSGSSVAPWLEAYRAWPGDRARAGEPADLETFAVGAYLCGDDDASERAWGEAYACHLDDDRPDEAARCASWLALTLMLRGRMAHASGWLGRAHDAIGDDRECAARGLLMIPAVLGALDEGDVDAARGMAKRAADIGHRLGDADVVALATLAHGQALIAGGDVRVGISRLDTAMLSVEAGAVGPIATGIVYCAVILECVGVLDYARAAEWTDALDTWCGAHPDLVPFRGQCLVHRSQLLQASGDMEGAVRAVDRALERLSEPPHPALGLAHYQEAELLRVRGSYEAAAEAYARATQAGHDANPGLALLQLGRGDVDAAAATVRRALQERTAAARRPPTLRAAVEIYRAAGDIEAARSAAEELSELASTVPSVAVRAMAHEVNGALLLADDPPAALAELRSAAAGWRRLEMPYEVARVGVLVGSACSALGDTAAATAEFEHARSAFEALGARPDAARVPSADEADAAIRSAGAPLTARELEVLSHVAGGRSSIEVAAELSISPHTVRRHLENVFAKLGVTSRAAAVARAYELGLL